MRKSTLLCCCLFLAACGGGGGGEVPLTVQVQNLTPGLPVVDEPITLLVVVTRGGVVAADYEGTITFSSSPEGAVVPWPFQMIQAFGGKKSFINEFAFPASGTHTIVVTAEDVPSPVSVDIEVLEPPPPPPLPPTLPGPTLGFTVGTLVPVDPPLTQVATTGVALGDFDMDGDLDVLFGLLSKRTQLYLNDGKARFTDRIAFGDGASLIKVDDLDGDGSPDIAYRRHDNKVTVRLNDGAGRFRTGLALPTGATDLDVGDIDGDGDVDLIVANGALVPWFNNGAGVFTAGTLLTSLVDAVTIADPDRDGDPDLLTSRGLFINDGIGGFAWAGNTWKFRAGAGFGDVDGDRIADIVDASGVYLNDGKGNLLQTPQEFGNIEDTILLIDIDFDKDLDVLAAGRENGVVAWRNDGTGVFTSFTIANMPTQALALAAGDLDRDLDRDVVVAGEDNPSVVLEHVPLDQKSAAD